MTILDCCITLKMIKKNLVVLGVVDMRQLLLNHKDLDLFTIYFYFPLFWRPQNGFFEYGFSNCLFAIPHNRALGRSHNPKEPVVI